jgi:hypothetical protein
MKNKTITNNKGSAFLGKLFVGLVALLLLSTSNLRAQVANYAFTQASGTFTPITGGTLLGSGTGMDDNTYPAVPLGFTFNYNGTNYTTINVNTNGWASFTSSVPNNYGVLTIAGNHLAACARDLQGQAGGALRVQTIGTECIIQWTNFRLWNGALTQNLNFQIRLNSVGNTIRFVYGTMTMTTTANSYDVGLNGTLATDFVCRTSTTSWTASTAGVTNFANMSLSPTVFPPSGHTYIWTPPSCSAPGGLAATITGGGTGANLSWNAAVPAPANGYQFAVTTSATPPGVGTPFAGTSTSVGSLTPSTNYFLHVRSDCGLGVFSGWSTFAFFTGYCPVSSSQAGEFINNFSTTGGITNISNLNSGNGAAPVGYQNWTALSVSQSAGGTINFSAQIPAFAHGLKIWVDWNNDLDFLDAGENVYTSPTEIGGGGAAAPAHNASFNVPGLQAPGDYRMRVRSMDWGTQADLTPCNLITWGECEDYTLTVALPPSCGIPTGLTLAYSSTTAANISWTAPVTGTVSGYEYSVSTSATPPGSGFANATTSVTGVAVLANTNYYLHVRTNCVSPTSNSPWATVGPFFSGYCVPVSTNDPAPSGDFIANVTTTGGLTNINNSSGTGIPFGYQNFTGISCSQIAGGAINFSVSTGGFAHNKRIWVDWNNDLDFNDVGELMFSSTAAAITHTGAFNVPALQATGSYRMRVKSVDGGQPIDPCATYSWTESEDYTFIVAVPPTCYPVSGLNITALAPTTVSFAWTAPTQGNAPVAYYYEVSTSATPPALGTANGTATLVNLEPHTPNTQNYIHVRVDCDGLGTDYSTWVTLPFFSGYCQPTSTTNNATYFSNWTTNGAVTNINNNSTFSTAPSGYQDFTSLSLTEYPGEEFAVQFTMVGGTAGVNVWIDWNNDLDFNDAGEFAVASNGFIASGTYNSVVTVPLTQAPGSYRVRARVDWNSGNPSACGNISQGEAEDYTITVIPKPVCSSVLGAFASTYTTSVDLPLVCTGQTINLLSAPDVPIATGITFQLQFSPNIGGPYNNVGAAQATNDFAVATPSSGFYRIQVLCSGTPLAGVTWTPVAVSISNPAITSTTPASRCGDGTLTLSATNTPALSTITWYQTAVGGIPLATGANFTTPVLSTTTSYYVQAENQVPNAQIGSGVSVNTATAQTPFSSFYEGVRMMYLIRKSELQASGLVASNLTTLAFNVSSTGVYGQNNFQIRMAHTSALNLNLGFATPNSGFTTVFAPATVPPPATGLRLFNLIANAFDWNGDDNLLIEICHENDPTGVIPVGYGTNSGVTGSFLTYNATYGRYLDNGPSCGLDVGTTSLINFRPNMQIGGQISACNSQRIEVIATVNSAPNISVPANQTFAPSVGNFNPIPLTASATPASAAVTVLPAAAIYLDLATTGSYTAGDNINGVTQYYAPLTTTTYTATATAANGCTATGTYTITVDQSGIPASACAATLVTSYNNLTWVDVNTLGSAGGLGAPCGGILNEVWFRAVVSASGELHVATRANGISLTDITESNVQIYEEVSGCANINPLNCNTNGGAGSFSYANAFNLTPGANVYIRVAGLAAAAVSVGRLEMAVSNYLVWTPTNGDDVSLPENWHQGDATAITIPNANRSIWVGAGTTTPRLTANTTVRAVNLQAAPPFYGSPGINLNGFTLNVKGNWNVGPVANASTVLSCNGLVEFNGASATPQLITGRTTFGNLNTNNLVGGVQMNNLTGVSCVLTPVAGSLNTNGNLVLKSTTANSAALVAPSAGTITGNATVERKIGPTSGYHYLSAPVSGAFVNNTVSGWRDDFTIIATNDGQIFIPGNVYTTLATVWEYNEPNTNPNPDYGWIGATGTTDAITPLKGFACVVPANVTVDVVGPLNNNIIPGGYTITRQTDGTNLIGNPYPSPISWNAFRGLASNTSALSTSGYKAFITTGGYAGAYGTWNGSVGSPASVTDKIASSQGVIVECLQPSATINALNTARLTTAADVSGQFFGYNSVPDLMRIEVQGNGFANETAIYFDASSTDAYNNSHDSKTLFAPTPGIPTIYSTVENTKLAINVMGNLNANKVVPMGVKIQTAGTYNIVATDMTSFAPSVIAYLEDTQAGTMTNLRTNPSYSVTLAEGEINDRFYIHFHPAVELNAVNETCAGNDGKLVINYPTTNTVNIVVKDAYGNVVATQNNVTGAVTVNNLVAGNYVAEMTFGVAPNTYTATDYFTVAGGNAVFANLSASANTVDMAANTTVQFTATAQGATGFNWNFGDGTIIINGPANVSHTFAQAGTYNVTFEASNGICNAVATTTVEVTNATGLTTIASSNLQVVGVGSRVTVRFGSKMEGTGNIEVINMLGEVVAHLDNVAMKGTREIDMTNIAAGQYLVRITNNNSLFTEKVYLSRQ